MNDINSPHHPLYFHPNDHPGLLLISKKLLGSKNYSTWRRSMLIALSAKNKLRLVNGEYEEPITSSNLRTYWERANDMLISWILNIVSEQIVGHSKEECFKLLGYPVGQPLHKKYLPPSQRTQPNNRPRIVNKVTCDISSIEDPISSQSSPLENSSNAPNKALGNQSDTPRTSMPHVARTMMARLLMVLYMEDYISFPQFHHSFPHHQGSSILTPVTLICGMLGMDTLPPQPFRK
ncbi:cysteine-rich receptor-like protein kinase 8 [Tanacetum coccineum]